MADIEVGEAGWKNEAFNDIGKGKSFVFFYDKSVKNAAKSLEAKRPIFENRVMIKKLVPGDQYLIIDTYARGNHFDEFPVEFARYQQKRENRPTGTPIEMWAILSDMQKAEYRAMNIYTIEQFAELPDSAGTKIMGLIEMRKKARAFILSQEAGEKLVKMEEEAKASAEEKAKQDKIISDLTERLAALEGGKRETLHAKQAAR